MTQADSAPALGMSLESSPIHGQAQATKITAATPLPAGWGSFCSKPDARMNMRGRWYAVAPWNVDTIKAQASDGIRHLAVKLEQTVDAATWVELHAAVAAQVNLYAEMFEGEGL